MIDDNDYMRIYQLLTAMSIFIWKTKEIMLIPEIENDVLTTYWFWLQLGKIKVSFQIVIDIHQTTNMINASILDQLNQFLNQVK